MVIVSPQRYGTQITILKDIFEDPEKHQARSDIEGEWVVLDVGYCVWSFRLREWSPEEILVVQQKARLA